MTCSRAQEFLARKRIVPVTVVEAKKQRFGRHESLELARSVTNLYVAKGKRVVHLDMKRDRPTDDQLLSLLLGPSGNLRAPAMRAGKTLLVGFEQETFVRVLR
jgi:arsenate reductase-like glutaredoxin family protein